MTGVLHIVTYIFGRAIMQDSPAHKEYESLSLVTVEYTQQKLQALIYDAVKMKRFMVIYLLKQTLLLVMPIDGY